MISNLRLQDLEYKRRRQVYGFRAGLALALLLWVGIVAAVWALL